MVLDVPVEGDPLAGVEAKLRQAPSFFDSAPIVLDMQAVAESGNVDLIDVVARLRELGLIPIGIQNGNDRQNATALAAGLCPFPLWRSGRQRPAREREESAETEPSSAGGKGASARPAESSAARREPARREPAATVPREGDASAALLMTRPIRSGRRVYAEGRDLVATASVSAGAELIADGNIHVYGTLRGRALAGVRGDEDARIFCQSLDAELVSVAGAYRVRDDIDEALIGQAVQIYLKDDRLVIDPLGRVLK